MTANTTAAQTTAAAWIVVDATFDTAALIGRTVEVRWMVQGSWFSGEFTADRALHSPTGDQVSAIGRLVTPTDRFAAGQRTGFAMAYGLAEVRFAA